MPETSPLGFDATQRPTSPESTAIEVSRSDEDQGILDDDVMIDVAPDRPFGTIRVKLVYAGRSTPLRPTILGPSDEVGMDSDGYPWYRVVQGTDLSQGDLLDRCPVFRPPADLTEPWEEAAFTWQEWDVIVMTQTCDIVPGREKVTEVLLCAAWSRSDLKTGHLATPPQAWKTYVAAICPDTICSPSATCPA